MTGSQNGITGNCVELAEHNLKYELNIQWSFVRVL